MANKILYFRKIGLTVSRNVLDTWCAQLFETCNFGLHAICELVSDSSLKRSHAGNFISVEYMGGGAVICQG